MTWHRSARDNRVWVSIDYEDIDEMRAAIEADRIACGGGKPCEDMPSHNTGYVTDEQAYTYRCPSFSRWFNPETHRMEGHAHCTCDYCF